jgi:hypothetical protein
MSRSEKFWLLALVAVTSIPIGVLTRWLVPDEPHGTILAMIGGVLNAVLWIRVFEIRRAMRSVDMEGLPPADVDPEFWEKAYPFLMEGRVVSGTRRPDGSMDLAVGPKPEERDQP